MAHYDRGTPRGEIRKVVGVSLLAPLSPKGTVIPQFAGIVLIDVGQFKLADPIGLFAALAWGFIELGIDKNAVLATTVTEKQ